MDSPASTPQIAGLDFGTSTTLIATDTGIVPIGQTAVWLPSVVGFDDHLVVAEAAEGLSPEQVVRSIKRCITHGHNEVRVTTADGIRTLAADDAMAAILREAIRSASGQGLVLTAQSDLRLGCPAMWDRSQRTRLLNIACKAGLNAGLEHLVDEPVAAGIAWLADNSGSMAMAEKSGRILVFDMGGGTLDIAVLDVRGSGQQEISVLAALGIPEAGDTLDEQIARDVEELLAAEGIKLDELKDPGRARSHLLDEAKETKIALSDGTRHPISLTKQFGKPTVWYERNQLESLFDEQLDRAAQYIAAALRTAKLTETLSGSTYDILKTSFSKLAEEIDHVVLSGGMSRIPLVTKRMSELFPKASISHASAPPENAVALGLATARRHSRINMFRPPFDIFVTWTDITDGEQRRAIYQAFTPLYQSGDLTRGGSQLGYKRNGLDLDLPRKAVGRLNVVSHSGSRAQVTLGGRNMDGFPLQLAEQKFEFFIQCNGRIRVTDAGGKFDGQIEDWHANESGFA